MKGRLGKVLAPLLFWFCVWALCAWGVGRELILPGPSAVGRSLLALLGEETFYRSMGASLARIGSGFLLGTVLGMALAVLTSRVPLAEGILAPALGTVRAVPVVSFILLLYYALPTERIPLAVAALMALPVVWRASVQAIAAADPLLLEMAGAYRLGRWQTFRRIRLPAALPALSAGWETALGLSWKSGVAAEVLCQPKWAAGSQLQAAKSYLDTAGVMAWSIAIVVLCLALEGLLKLALRRWRGGNGQ